MFTLAILGAALSPAAPALKDKAPLGPAVVGRWECSALVINGKPDPQWEGLGYEFTTAGKWIIYRNGQVLDDKDRTYRLDPKAGPGAIDVTEGPQPQAAAFRVEKDILHLAIQTDQRGRPAGPEAAGQGIMTFTFKRVGKGR